MDKITVKHFREALDGIPDDYEVVVINEFETPVLKRIVSHRKQFVTLLLPEKKDAPKAEPLDPGINPATKKHWGWTPCGD